MKRILLAALAIAALPLAAQAGDLSYNYVQGGYSAGHNDDSGRDSHGWTVNGSAAIGQNFQIIGGYANNDQSVPDSSSRSSHNWNLGAGFHTPVSGNTDFVGDVAYHRTTVDGVPKDIATYTGEVGVRSAMAPHFEGWAMAGYSDAHNPNGDDGNGSHRGEIFGKLGGQYKFDKTWGLVAEGRLAEHDRSVFVGPRISF